MPLPNFEDFYMRTLETLQLFEGRRAGGQILLGRTHWCRGFLRRLEPQVLGIVTEKPRKAGETYVGNFRAIAGLKGPVWDLANKIEQEFGVGSHVTVDPSLPV